MALRQFLYLDTTNGRLGTAASTDDIQLGGASLSGDLAMGSNQFVGLADATTDGDVLVYGQTGADLDGLTMTGNLAMGGFDITGLASGTDGTDAATYDQLQTAMTGLSWKDPAVVLHIVSNADQSGVDPTETIAGNAWEVKNWATKTNGDLLEWDGSQWNTIVANSGGYVPSGTRVVVAPSGLSGDFTGRANQINYANGSGGWIVVTGANPPSDGDALMINGEGSVYENSSYVYDSADTAWEAFTGANTLVDGAGLDYAPDNVTLDIEYTANHFEIATDNLQVDIDAAGAIEFVGGELAINLAASNPGLEFSTGMRMIANNSAGIQLGASGVEVYINDTPDTLDADASGLKVTGVPSLFEINSVAVGSTVTASNINAICAGGAGAGDGLHRHDLGTIGNRIEKAYTAGENITAGDPVYMDASNDTVGKARADTDAKSFVIGIAKETITTGNPIQVISVGVAADTISGATSPREYYLGATGGTVENSPPGTGNHVVLVGYAGNSTDLVMNIQHYGKH